MALLKLMTCSFQVLRWQKSLCWEMKLVKLEVFWSSCSSLRNRSKGYKLNISKTWRKRGLIWSHFPLTNHCWICKSNEYWSIKKVVVSIQKSYGRPKRFFSSSVVLEFYVETWNLTYFSGWKYFGSLHFGPLSVERVRFRGTLAWRVAELHCMWRRSCTALCHLRRFVKDDMATWVLKRIRKWLVTGGWCKHQLVLFIFTFECETS